MKEEDKVLIKNAIYEGYSCSDINRVCRRIVRASLIEAWGREDSASVDLLIESLTFVQAYDPNARKEITNNWLWTLAILLALPVILAVVMSKNEVSVFITLILCFSLIACECLIFYFYPMDLFKNIVSILPTREQKNKSKKTMSQRNESPKPNTTKQTDTNDYDSICTKLDNILRILTEGTGNNNGNEEEIKKIDSLEESSRIQCAEIERLKGIIDKDKRHKNKVFEFIQDHSSDLSEKQTLFVDFAENLIDEFSEEYKIIHYTDESKPLPEKDLFVVMPLNGVLEIQEKKPAVVFFEGGVWHTLFKGKVHVPKNE